MTCFCINWGGFAKKHESGLWIILRWKLKPLNFQSLPTDNLNWLLIILICSVCAWYDCKLPFRQCKWVIFFSPPCISRPDYFPALFPRLPMSLFSRISVFCSGCSTVFDTIAFPTIWIGMDMDVEPTADKALKNVLASHSTGRLSCLSTSKTLLERSTKVRGDLLIYIGLDQVM